MIELALFIGSLAFLVKSAEVFTEKAEKLGLWLKIPSFIVGVTIVAVGTGMPELASSLAAVWHGSPSIVMSSIIGSNIANILLILGVAALLLKREHKFKHDILHGDITFLIMAALLLGIVISDGNVSNIEAALLFIGYGIYALYNYGLNKKNKEKKREVSFSAIDGIALIVSVAIIVIASDVFIGSALNIAEKYNIGVEVMGLVGIAIGTSLPELAVAISAVKKGNVEMAFGSVSGSNIFNTFVVASVPKLLGNITFPTALLSGPYMYLLLASAVFLSVALDKKIHKYEGAMLLLLYAFFIVHSI
ncbi:MAG: sodium:calcium antiporter [Methanobacteriota archaeon]|nr:MAG: sodium:calcium antiporter [Euryarchaeota archaeon]